MIHRFPSFLTSQQCTYLSAQAYNYMIPNFRPIQEDYRTGCLYGNHCVEADKIRRLCSQTAGVPISHVEPIEIIRYEKDAEYGLHYDDHWRSWTTLVFLNHGFKGGRLVFPKIRKKVEPRMGLAICWQNAEGGDHIKKMAHRGEIMEKGTKWIAVTWAREKPYAGKKVPD